MNSAFISKSIVISSFKSAVSQLNICELDRYEMNDKLFSISIDRYY